jgi:hypothetical protein
VPLAAALPSPKIHETESSADGPVAVKVTDLLVAATAGTSSTYGVASSAAAVPVPSVAVALPPVLVPFESVTVVALLGVGSTVEEEDVSVAVSFEAAVVVVSLAVEPLEVGSAGVVSLAVGSDAVEPDGGGSAAAVVSNVTRNSEPSKRT